MKEIEELMRTIKNIDTKNDNNISEINKKVIELLIFIKLIQ